MAVDLGPIAKTAAALAKPLVKLIDVAKSGVGAISAPLLTVLNAHGDGKASLVRKGYEHQGKLLDIKNAAELKALRAAQKATAPQLSSPGTAAAAQAPDATTIDVEYEVLFEEEAAIELAAAKATDLRQTLKRRANVMTIIAEAAEQMGPDAADEPVDADWIARFFTYAQDVSPEQLQALWGQALAREVEKPGTIPLRTLDLLRNMTKSELALVERLSTMVTKHGMYLPYGGEHGLTGREVYLATDARLLGPEVPLNWKITARHKPGAFPNDKGELRFTYPHGETLLIEVESTLDIVVGFHATASTLPLLNLCSRNTDPAYLAAAAEQLRAGGKRKVTVGPRQPPPGGAAAPAPPGEPAPGGT